MSDFVFVSSVICANMEESTNLDHSGNDFELTQLHGKGCQRMQVLSDRAGKAASHPMRVRKDLGGAGQSLI